MITYETKVRTGDTFLWGSDSVTKDVTSDLYLNIQVDEFGEAIELFIKTMTNAAARESYGSLGPGQVYAIRLNQLSAIIARTTAGNVDSLVRCTVLVSG